MDNRAGAVAGELVAAGEHGSLRSGSHQRDDSRNGHPPRCDDGGRLLHHVLPPSRSACGVAPVERHELLYTTLRGRFPATTAQSARNLQTGHFPFPGKPLVAGRVAGYSDGSGARSGGYVARITSPMILMASARSRDDRKLSLSRLA